MRPRAAVGRYGRRRGIAILRTMSSTGRTHALQSSSTSQVRWRVVEIDRDAHRARLAPYLARDALTDLLDSAYGVAGWGNRFVPFGAHAVGCELDIGGVVKSAVVGGGPEAVDPVELAAASLTEAAHMHGADLPVDPRGDAWVDWDPDERVPLYWPEAAEAGRPGMVGSDAEAARAGAGGAAADVTPDATAKPLGTPAEASGQAPIRSEGQRAIDKLVDRLREAGRGLDAARLVMEHKGYGNDPDEARELYARLRQLLLDGRAS